MRILSTFIIIYGLLAALIINAAPDLKKAPQVDLLSYSLVDIYEYAGSVRVQGYKSGS